MKLIYMATAVFAIPTLKKIRENGHQILSIITQPDRPGGRNQHLISPPIKEYALNEGLPLWQPESIGGEDFYLKLKDLNPEVIVVVAYGKFIPLKIINLPQYRCVNLHPSLLPKYRGAAPLNWAIINGEKKTGVTTMQITPEMDAGDIYLQEEVEISEEDDADTLSVKTSLIGGELILQTLEGLRSGKLTAFPQDRTKVTFAPKLKKEDGLINWENNASDIAKRIRGLIPWPAAYTFWKNKSIKIWLVVVKSFSPDSQNLEKIRMGEIINLSAEGIEVRCGKDNLLIKELQMENSRRMSAKDFLCGHRLKIGDIFSSHEQVI